MKLLLLAIGFVSLTVVNPASAREYGVSYLPYSDAPTDLSTALAVSTLTEENIVQGNPDGTFRPNALLNRAEFLKIAMGLLPEYGLQINNNCFPDVDASAWYSEPVCKAKELGIVRGNAQAGVDSRFWLFAPQRNVQYVEALKILAEIYEYDVPPASNGVEWYVPYLLVARDLNVELPEGLTPGHLLTRGQMARLVVRFLALSEGELQILLATEQGQQFSSSSQSSMASQSSSSRSSVGLDNGWTMSSSSSQGLVSDNDFSSSSSSSSSSSVQREQDPKEDVSVQRQFLLLGETGPVMGAATVFSEVQPVNINDMIIELTSSPTSVSYFLVYDEDGGLLGQAYRDSSDSSGKTYALSLKSGELRLEQETDFTFYVRPVLRPFTSGGKSGEIIAISKLGIEGDGVYNSKTVRSFSNESYQNFQTSRSVISSISNGTTANDFLVAGTSQKIGTFVFSGKKGDGGADLAVTDLIITADQVGGVTLNNVELATEGLSERISCSSIVGQITCSSIPEVYGSFKSASRKLTLYADVSVSSSSQKSSLQLRINQPGTVLSAGDITWTDGENTFQWVKGDAPVVRSTFYSN